MSTHAELPGDLQELLNRVAAEDRGAVAEALQRTMRSEAELREASERMAEAQRIANFGDWEWNLATGEVTWSEELYRIFDVDRENFAGTLDGYLELVHPDDREKVADAIQAAVGDKSRLLLEHRIGAPDGGTRTMRCHGEPVTDTDGNVVRFFGVCQDVTELADSERGRRSAEDRFRSAFENAPIGVALVAIDGEALGSFLAVNRAMCTLTGYTEKQLAATSIDEITAPEDRQLDSAQRRRLMRGKFESYTVEKRFLHRDGHELWGQFSLSLAPEADGGAPYAICRCRTSASAAASSSVCATSPTTIP